MDTAPCELERPAHGTSARASRLREGPGSDEDVTLSLSLGRLIIMQQQRDLWSSHANLKETISNLISKQLDARCVQIRGASVH